ncbi:MAG: NHL repeat-containing protein [Candidatus Glassbacteria bacterium]
MSKQSLEVLLIPILIFLTLLSEGSPSVSAVKPEVVSYGKSGNIIFKSPAGIFFDSRQREIYVTDSGSSSVLIFNESGEFLFSFPHWVRRGGEKVKGEPRDIVVDSRGLIYLTDSLSREIDVLNARGIVIDYINPLEFEAYQGRIVYPQYMAIDPHDTLFVTLDGDVKEIMVLDPEYNLVRRMEVEQEEGFGGLSGIALDKQGNVLITDIYGHSCVGIYSRSGRLLQSFGRKAIGDENFSHPHGLACTGDGDIWVVDSFRQVVKRFSPAGEFKEMVGGFGIMPGDYQYPVGITSDLGKRLFVVERVGRRFQILRTD